jgi:hypothetical protein
MIARASAFALLLAATTAASLLAQQQPAFPHAMHTRLFPLCTACHVMEGARSGWYPSSTVCSSCHDGVVQPRVEWSPPASRTSLLDFSHEAHFREAAEDNIACEGCHVGAGLDRMGIDRRAVVGQCLACHEHQADQHLVDARCSGCHITLAESSFDAERVLALPMPPGHSASDFLMNHEGDAQCSVCHTRERCTTCHVNADVLADVQALPVAGPTVELPRWTPEYPVPPSHSTAEWLWQHGGDAGSAAACSTCHTRDSCTTCHVQTPPSPIAGLPSASHVQAPGVQVERVAPASHASPAFETSHAPYAETATSSCTTCHARSECAACHDAAANAGFHPPNFIERHPTEAFARRLECANCHDVEIFCASCHQSAGRSPSGVTGAVYHDAEAAWLLRHGQAARQGLESCVGCHRPPDCLRCHSQLGAFQISPHGRDFDAEQARRRNAFVCRTCHIRDPLRSGGG